MILSRRTILFAAAAAAAVVASASSFMRKGPARRTLTAEQKNACALTAEAVEGPYWVSGMPVVADGNINSTNLPGTAIEMSGFVYDGLDTSKPIANAEVEIWHADNAGSYHPNGNGPATGYKPEELALRGTVITGADGAYKLKTIFPGEYSGRVRHYHFKIRAAGKSELTTQLIFPARPGDTLTFDTDDIAEGLPNCQQLTVDETVTPAQARFDFRV
jgi:protocatechuate 3,4-dioxygenase beta subunit